MVASRQPEKEHVMNPTPSATNPVYCGSNKLQRKVTLVTGGDSGFGRAVCYCFALEGVTVDFAYEKGEDKDAQDTLLVLTEDAKEREPMAAPADLGDDENCKRVVEQVMEKYRRIDNLTSF